MWVLFSIFSLQIYSEKITPTNGASPNQSQGSKTFIEQQYIFINCQISREKDL